MTLKQTRNLWRVEILAHHVPPRWDVPATTIELGGPSAEYAREQVVKWAHSDAGVPPMRSLVRGSLAYASVKRVAREILGFA